MFFVFFFFDGTPQYSVRDYIIIIMSHRLDEFMVMHLCLIVRIRIVRAFGTRSSHIIENTFEIVLDAKNKNKKKMKIDRFIFYDSYFA